MKVSELTGPVLDYWVARANGAQTDLKKMKVGDEYCAIQMVPNAIKPFPACIIGSKIGRGKYPRLSSWYYPSKVWTHGGPIIERECMCIYHNVEDGTDDVWHASMSVMGGYEATESGPTLLVAAMRAYVVSKLGHDIPDETPA